MFVPWKAETAACICNIFMAFIGSGVLSLPYAFSQAGVLEGTVIFAAVATLAIKAMTLIIDCKYEIIRQRQGVSAKYAGNRCEYEKVSIKPDSDDEHCDNRSFHQILDTESPPHRVADLTNHDDITFSDVAAYALGPMGQTTVDVMIVVSQIGFCCSYLIFIIHNMYSVVYATDGVVSQSDVQQEKPIMPSLTTMIFIMTPLFTLTLLPDLSRLTLFSVVSQMSNLFAFLAVFYFDFDHIIQSLTSGHFGPPTEFNFAGLPFFFSVSVYCFEGAALICCLEQSTDERIRRQFKSILSFTLFCLTTLYICFGVAGYLSFGDATRDIITLNLATNVDAGQVNFATLVKVCLSLSVYLCYPMMLYPVLKVATRRCCLLSLGKSPFLKTSPEWTVLFSYVLIRLFFVCLTVFIVYILPKFALIISLVGATCCTTIAFTLPGLCHLIIFRGKLESRADYLPLTKIAHTPSDDDLATDLEPNLNRSAVLLDYLIVATGLLGLLIGTASALHDILTL